MDWMGDFQFYALFNSIIVNQDDGRAIMNGCVQWNLVYESRTPTPVDLEPGSKIG